ncbi:MAG: phosphonopyruvate decarboxylase [Clostridia bacterium]|nr:phosphonopyruvate decarboxylase [Clostridia bacterium]
MKLNFLNQFDFFAGVPDSLLRPLCDWLITEYGISKKHIVAANEGNALALAAGYHLATGKIPVVYMQNSGIGNIINPLTSLMNDKVYAIPCVFIVGWRGEPGVHDEPQHIYQGEVTVKLLEDMDVRTFIIGKETSEDEVLRQLEDWKPLLSAGKQVAFVVKKGALEFDGKAKYSNDSVMIREEIIRHITARSGSDPIISTTGKASRELFEIREANGDGHGCDFLTVGSMGHSSSIALEIALQKPERKIWCIDGDGALLMHMGAMALIGSNKPKNLVHVVINNGAHETVGGMPTVASDIDVTAIARACGYPNAVSVSDYDSLDRELEVAKDRCELSLIEVKCSIGARADLGRPTTTAIENKMEFMKHLR